MANENKPINGFPVASKITSQSKVLGIDPDTGAPLLYDLSELRSNNIGQFKTTDPAPENEPLPNQNYTLVGTAVGQPLSGTYTNLLMAAGTPLVIPNPADGNVIINASAVYDGTYYTPIWQEIPQQGSYIFKFDQFDNPGFFYNNSGVLTTGGTWTSFLTPIGTGSVTYHLYGSTAANIVSFFDANMGYISGVAGGAAGTLKTGTIALPANTKFIGVSTLIVNLSDSYVNYTSNNLPDYVLAELNKKAVAGWTSGDTAKSLKQVSVDAAKALVKETIFPDNGFYTPSGVYNPASSFKSRTITFIAGFLDTIQYSLTSTSAGGGAALITFFDASNVKISSINAVIGVNTGTANVPSNAVKAVISVLATGLSTAYYIYKQAIDSALQTVNTTLAAKQDKPSGRILIVSKTATPDATHFNSVTNAIAAWLTGDQIQIFDGIYQEQSLLVPDGAYIKGVGNVEIRGVLADNSTSILIDATSTFDFQNSGTLENLIITCRNMRYPVHSDFGSALATQNVINCRLVHYGNFGAYQYRVTNSVVSPNAPADTWLAQSAWGCGSQSGSKIYIKNTVLKSPMRAFSTHNNANYNSTSGASLVQCDNCDFISDGLNLDGTSISFKSPAFVQSLSSFTYDKIVFNNCRINGFLVLQSTSGDWREFTQDVSGGANSNHLMQIRNSAGGSKLMTSQTTTQNNFIIKVNAPNTSDIVVTGNLIDAIFGNYSLLKGSTGLNSWIKGRVPHGTAWVNVNSYGGTKTITFIAGATTKTITLSATYTSATQLVTDINTQFSTSGFTAELYWSGFDWYPKFTDEINSYQNNGATAIIRGRAVKISGFGGVALMTSSDSANQFYGIAVQDIPVGQVGDVKFKGYMLRIWADGLFGTTLTDGDNIKVNSDGTFSKATNGGGEVIVSKCITNENIAINIS